VDLDDGALERLGAYRELLLHWNRRINLVARTDVDALETRHLLDSLTILPPLLAGPGGADVPLIDLGSGGGLPGLVLACADPRRRIALIEPVTRKTAFLRAAVRELALPRVSVHEGRADRVPPAVHEALGIAPGAHATAAPGPVITARAVAPLGPLCELAAPLAAPGSRFLFPKARGYADELAGVPAPVRLLAVHEFRLPPDDRSTFVIELAPGAAGP
jgi:16S rRNA (guanine527-N7)-methyltransferase